MLTEWVRICNVSDIDKDKILSVSCKGNNLLVAKLDDTVHVVDSTCTHQDADLSCGFLSQEGIRCPLHLSVFDLSDGKPQNPPAEQPIRVYPVKIDGTEVYVEV